MKAALAAVAAILSFAAPHPTWPEEGECRQSGPVANVTGWPVSVAFKVSKMAGLELHLGFYRSRRRHTNVTLSYEDEEVDSVVLRATVEAPEERSIPAVVSADAWSRLTLDLRRRKMVLTVRSRAEGVDHTARTSVDLPRHRGVDSVSFSCPGTCLVDVDLLCLDERRRRTKEIGGGRGNGGRRGSPRGSNPSWPVFLLAALFLLVLLLFGAWRCQRRQIRRRQARKGVHGKAEEEEGRNPAKTGERKSRSGGYEPSGRVQYSKILRGYDGPCRGDEG